MTRTLAAAALLLMGGCLPEEASDAPPSSGRADAGEADGATDTGVTPADGARGDASSDAAADGGAVTDGGVTPDGAPPCGPPPFDPQVSFLCPGGPGCGPRGPGLNAGASALPITDLPFELPRRELLRERERCNEAYPAGAPRCGTLDPRYKQNCGRDDVCPGDEGYVGPDADGSEGDLNAEGDPIYDYYRDCGADNLCPGDPGYTEADEGEANGRFDGLWIAGFGTNRPALGVRDHLWARTVAFEQGETLVTVTSIDAIGVFWDDVDRIRTRARELLAAEHPELDVDYMLVSSTHDHEAPDTSGQWPGEVDPDVPIPLVSGVNPRYIAHLREQAAHSIVEAIGALQPASMRLARGRSGAEGLFRDSRDPVIINDEVNVLQLTDAVGDTIATLVNWGNHPESMSDDNNYLTSDFAHGIRDALENGIPDSPVAEPREGLGGIAVYLQGTVGGLMTPLGVRIDDRMGNALPNETFQRADAMGWKVATAALDALQSGEAVDVEDPRIQVTAAELDIPVENRLFHVAIALGLFDRVSNFYDSSKPITRCNLPHAHSEMAILRVGPLSLYTVPGELFPELAVGGYDGSLRFGHDLVKADNPNPPDLDAAPSAPYFRDAVPGDFVWTLGLGNDFVGYLVPEYDYELHAAAPYVVEAEGDHYEETNSVGPNAVPRIRVVLERLIARLQAEDAP